MKPDPLKRRRRGTKCHTAKTLEHLEATVTQLTDTVGDRDLFNSSLPNPANTDPLKRRQRTKCYTAKTLAPLEAAVTQLTDTVGDTDFNKAAWCRHTTKIVKFGYVDDILRGPCNLLFVLHVVIT